MPLACVFCEIVAGRSQVSTLYEVEGSGDHIAIETSEMVARAIREVLTKQEP
jgi:hypothetical protein